MELREKTMDFTTTSERDEQILEYHSAHMPLRDIGKRVGLSHEGVRKIILKAFEQTRKVEIVQLIQAEGEHLADEAISNLREIALDKTVAPRTRNDAWDKARLWHESKRKLFGADAPIRKEIEIADTSTWEWQMRSEIAQIEAANERKAAKLNEIQ